MSFGRVLGFLLCSQAHVAFQRRSPLALFSSTRCFAAGSPERVQVEETGAGLAHTLRTGRHTLTGDLMPEAGGSDVGPSPKELLMLSLALCTSMTVRLYAQRSGFPLNHVAVDVEESCLPGEHVPQSLSILLRLEGELSEAQRERLLRAASRCPVKAMLSGATPLSTTLV